MATRKEICEAFKAAKAITALSAGECCAGGWRGEYGKYEFICHALDKLHEMPGAKGAKSVIIARFNSTIYGWLNDVAKVPSRYLTDDNVQAYKHRWLDSVIEEFSK